VDFARDLQLIIGRALSPWVFGLWSQFAVLISQITFKPVHTDFEWMVEYSTI